MRARRSGQDGKAKRAGVAVSTGRGHCAEDVVESNDRSLRRRLRRGAVALGAGADEHALALLFELVQRAIGIRQRRVARADRVRKRANPMVREQHALKGREIVQELLRRQALDLRMIDQRAERLLLQRRHAGIELVSTGVVRASGPRVDAVRSCELHVVDGRNRAPDVDERLARWAHW